MNPLAALRNSAEAITPPRGLYVTPLATAASRRVLARRLAYIMLVRVILYTLVLGGTVAMHLVWRTPERLGGTYIQVLFVFIASVYVINIGYAAVQRFVPRASTGNERDFSVFQRLALDELPLRSGLEDIGMRCTETVEALAQHIIDRVDQFLHPFTP